ncbi:ABC transporter permease [Paenibacillus sp. EZ-K15]|uniref:ABC transporter permease n=1 Tax=Paenibacillus sp. EZ-K15 TaxID=2044275 RepID=UPI000BF4DD87|nr:ABC transporter permease [Paenibacillus sp. EZ-K15]
MRSFGNLVWNEWLKMFKKRSFFLPYALLAGMVIFMAFLLYKFSGGGSTGYEFAEIAVTTKGMGQVLTLLAIVVTAGAVAKEHSMGTIKLLLIRAQSRTKILASKYVAVLIYTFTLVAFMFAVAVLAGQITFGMDVGSVTLGDVLIGAVNNLVYTIVYVTLTFMVGILTKSTGPAIGIGMFMVIMESMVVQLLARYSWSKYLLFLNVDLSMYNGGASSPIPGMSLTFSMIVLAVYLLLFLAIGFVTFKKRDVA